MDKHMCFIHVTKFKFVGLITYWAVTMLDVHNDFATKFQRDISWLFSVHYIAHREALAASDDFKKINQLDFS